MSYNWYALFNLTEFLALDLVSKNVTLLLEEIGEISFTIFQGEHTSILYEGVFLSLNINDRNPFFFESHGIYVDSNNDVWLGIEIES